MTNGRQQSCSTAALTLHRTHTFHFLKPWSENGRIQEITVSPGHTQNNTGGGTLLSGALLARVCPFDQEVGHMKELEEATTLCPCPSAICSILLSNH